MFGKSQSIKTASKSDELRNVNKCNKILINFYSNKNMMTTTASTTNLGPQQRKKMLTMDSNGSLPLPYPSEPPDDENMNEIIAEDVELEVQLPSGQFKHVTVSGK